MRMLPVPSLAMACCLVAAASSPAPVHSQAVPAPAAPGTAADTRILAEDFDADPLLHGWSTFGDAQLFAWEPGTGSLQVTWDSSRANSYLRLPLGTELTRHDDFSAALDLTLHDIAAGVRDGHPGTFQIALGFQNRADAGATNFVRGTGSDSPNLVEFNFFPDTGYGPTVWPAVTATNGVMNYGGASDFSLFELPLGITLRLKLAFDATAQAVTLTIMTNDVPVGPTTTARLTSRFGGFLVDTFAVASYSEAGQGPFMPGSILAHATLDNLVLTLPPPPVRSLECGISGGRWSCSFLSRPHWIYWLESSTDLLSWRRLGEPAAGDGGAIRLADPEPTLAPRGFYRVSATAIP